MRSFLFLSAFAVGLTSLAAFAEEVKKPAAGYSNLLPTEKDLEKSTAAAEAKAKADKEKSQRTGTAPALPKGKSKLSLSATCKDSSGKSYISTDPGYDSCMQLAGAQAQLRRETPASRTGTDSSTSTDSSTGAGFQFKVGE